MVTFPNAKINLGLFITDKRSDGYHSIESIFYPVKIADILEAGEFGKDLPLLKVSGMEIEGNADQNLVVKAIRILEEYLTKKSDSPALSQLKNIRFYLHKIIPTGAGLGGGSADGTFALKILNEKLALQLDSVLLEKMALQLGSDCPFFVRNSPALVKGRGEMIEDYPLDLSAYELLLVHPGIHISTKEAYAGVKPEKVHFDWKKISDLPVREWKDHLRNDFEKTVFASHPEINEVKKQLYANGAVYAQMSGSGSAVLGIFEKGILPSGNTWFAHQKNYRVFTCEL